MITCDMCGQDLNTQCEEKDQLIVLTWHKLIKHGDEIVDRDPIIIEARGSKMVRYYDKGTTSWKIVTPMDNFSYDLNYSGAICRDDTGE